jgi:predicted DNA-binding helix-hairpin-helix protein
MEELPFNSNGHLPLDVDPKYAWAKQNLSSNPIEINKADKHTLLRIPGIGIKSADSILQARIRNKVASPAELSSFGVNLKRAAPFILVNGKFAAYQTSFF